MSQRVTALGKELQIKAAEKDDVLNKEMGEAAKAVDAAARRMEEMLLKVRV